MPKNILIGKSIYDDDEILIAVFCDNEDQYINILQNSADIDTSMLTHVYPILDINSWFERFGYSKEVEVIANRVNASQPVSFYKTPNRPMYIEETKDGDPDKFIQWNVF